MVIDTFEKIIKESNTIYEVLLKLGKNTSSASYKQFHRIIKKHQIDISHLIINRSEFIKKMYVDGRMKKIPTDEIFKENSTISRNVLKRRIILENLLKYECFKCGNDGNWNGERITLILDHINGVNNDNRLVNLRFTCPNCNATLETHCIGHKIYKINKLKEIKKVETIKKRRSDRYNIRKVERPDIDTLINEINQIGYSATGRKYGVSDNAIRKWVKQYNFIPPRKYNLKK